MQSVAALNWLGVTINPGAGVDVGVGDRVGLAVGKGVGVDLGVGVGLGEGCGEGVAGDTGDGTFEEAPGDVCEVTRVAVFGEKTGGKAKADIAMIIAAMTIDEVVTAIQKYLEPWFPLL